MDSVRDLIAKKLKARGLTMKAASLQIGKSHAYLQQFLERGVPASLPEGPRGALAALLQVEEDALRGAVPSSGRTVSSPSRLPPQIGTADRLPVLGMAECGPDGWALWNGEVVDYVARPSNLAGVTQAYAVFVVGNSMEPRYFPGELVHVHPGRPVTIGSFVLVQIRAREDGEAPRAVIKRLVRRSGNKIVLEQYNPKKSFELKADELVSMHRVVASGEA
jgi:phage repressor protein C with HTH and peptisase S24 domain